MGNPISRFFRSLTRPIMAWTLIVMVFAPFLASPAQAQVTVVGDVPRTTDNLLNTIFTSITRAGMVALFNAFQTFLGQLAYDAADYIATGSSGQAATYFKKGVGDYLRDVASDAAGEFIGSLSSEEFFRGAGFDLCRPDANVLLRVQLSLGNFFPGLQGRFERPRPRCNFKDIIKNYDRLYQSLTNDDVLKNVQLSLNTNSSDLGVTFNIMNQFSKKIATNVNDRARERAEGGGFKSINNFLSGNIKTPAQVVNETAREQLVKFPNASLLTTVGATLSSGMEQGFIQLAAYTASIFVNTLTSKLLRRIFEGGLDAGVAQLQIGIDQVTETRQLDTRNLNVSLKTPNLQKVEEFDVITELTTCPNDSRGTWNCAMDQGLRTALSRNDQGGMTVQGALAAGLLHGDWQLVPNTDLRRNQERECFTRAYCAGNLQKLRLLRILPVGFELAANSAENVRRCGAQGTGCVTLQEVVDGFSRCSGADASPWCRMIDPNWVLTSLPQQCVLKGYGDQLISSTLGQRREECQDVQTCLRRNDQGECIGGYGYCVAEKSVYRFGADECLPREASCRNYQSRAGASISYLRNTTDQATCSAENVGCTWYATTRDPSRGAEAWVGTTTTGPRVYFDAEAEGCSANNEGCTKLREVVSGRSSLNLVLNPSFERVEDGRGQSLQNWLVGPPGFVERAGTPATVTVGTAALSGTRVANAETEEGYSANYQQNVSLVGGRVYTLSLFARAKGGVGEPRVNAAVSQFQDRARALPADTRGYFQSSGCARSGAPSIVEPRAGSSLGTDWQRYECSFLATSSTMVGTIIIQGNSVLIDDVQLEEGEFATDFVDGLNTQLAERHLKVAPDEFACTGADSDHPSCDRYAQMCRQTEAGCNGYTDVNTGGREIPAILSSNDLCPAECVGYAEYRKGPSSFDLVADPDPRFSDPGDASSTAFIPSTAISCRREEVGCEAFTNVEGTDGEQQAYFSYVRSCRKPGPGSQTFFTWEGSDTAGYQLRTWSLVRDSATPPAPLIVAKREPGRLFAKDPLSCNESSWRTALDPDCRQFYDAEGRISYRYYSQTVLSTPECKDFRISQSNRVDCEKTDGVFDASVNECLYRVYVPQSQLCRAEAVGCREYRGATSGGSVAVLTESFRGDATSTRGFVGGRLSNESLLVGDQSLRLDVPAGRSASLLTRFVSPPGESIYNATFWAKSPSVSSTLQISVRHPQDSAREPVLVGSVQLGTDWQRYTVGPFNGYPGMASSSLVWTAGVRSAGYVVFLDEVSIVRVQDVVYARRDSWTTPDSCNQNAYGVPQSQAMLGCRAYRNRQNQNVNVRQFTRLCREAAIGCKGFIDTRNSTAVGAEIFERGDRPAIPGFGTATTTRLADRFLYLIDEESKRCPADQASCRAFGRPVFEPDRQTIRDFTTVYLKDDITRYNRMLCRPSELFCEEFTYNNAKEYFRNPDNHVCEYREEASGVAGVPAGTYAGWFQAGVTPPTPCYPELLESGRTFGLAKRGDPMYRGWVGLCRASAGECTELRDPMDTSEADHPSGKPYYFIRNENLDTTSCAGNVDAANGCILMRDTTDTENRYNVRASYAKQQSLPRPGPSAPVDCTQSSNLSFCAPYRTGSCVGEAYATTLAGERFSTTDSPPSMRDLGTCRVDADCTVSRRVATNRVHVYRGTCRIEPNDSNLIVKVRMDRDCSQWLGCSSSEVVYDPATNRTRNLCTNLALCDKGSQSNGDPYCTGYVDRSSTSTEPILANGIALTSNVYTNRAVGLGQRDYSGYAIPNAFLATDLVNARVAIDGTGNDYRVSGKYARDYRLAAAVSMPPAREVITPTAPCDTANACFTHQQAPLQNQAFILDRRSRIGVANPGLHLCQHIQTGLVGYFVPNEVGATSTSFCYLSAAFDPLSLTGNPEARRSPYDFQSIAETFKTANPSADTFARQAFPAAECRAYPQPDAPFASNYVTRWDLTKSPPKPVDRLPGFTRVNVCEYGEDCLCTYKRADYNQAAVSKFYQADSQDIPSGVCVGGPRDGETCLPSSVLNMGSGSTPPSGALTGTGVTTPGPTTGNTTRQRVVEASNASQSCGDPQLGGRCIPLSRIETVRGVFGQCLERDATRSVRRGDTNEQPCLTWSPGPILFGEKDVYHYTPSAGYSPPPSSGQYYCTSAARKPRTLRMNPNDFEGSGNPASSTYAGQMHAFYYDDLWVSDEGKSEASLDGQKTDGSLVAQQCEEADDDQDDDDSASDINALRLVDTGHDLETSYTETFFKINAVQFVGRLFNTKGLTLEGVRSGLSDSNIGFMNIAPFSNKNGIGRIGCGYQADWVDNLSTFDYDEIDQSKRADQEWRQKFFATYNPIMTRASEKMLNKRSATDGRDMGTPVKGPCVRFEGIETEMTECYFKTWEVGHRLEGQAQAFSKVAFGEGDNVINSFEDLRARPEYERCSADKPYFGIRAVFQTNADDRYQGVRGPSDFGARNGGRSPRGPWRFVGFWVASCAAAADDVRYMYMNVDVTSADICKELAEVRSKDSLQDAAFTDRVWKEGSFTVPRIGISQGTRFAPFASALTTRSIGKDDQALFQTGQEIAGFSPLVKPTFIASGADTYYRPDPYPKDKWSYLSNLFGRVYRVYRYQAQPVLVGSDACLYGPFKGNACIPGDSAPSGGYATSSMCSLDGECDTTALAREDLAEFKVCDSLSGINAGLSCGSDPDICHSGAVMINRATGERKQMLAACSLNRRAWRRITICDRRSTRSGAVCNTDFDCGSGGTCIQDPAEVYDDLSTTTVAERLTTSQIRSRLGPSGLAGERSLYTCEGGMRSEQSCSSPSPESRECPIELIGKCVKDPLQRSQGPYAGADNNGAVQDRMNELGRCAFRAVDDSGRERPDVPIAQMTAAGTRVTPGSEVLLPIGGGRAAPYKVVESEEYEGCYADYDCSFNQYNYYLKRSGGFPNIYSPRSYRWLARVQLGSDHPCQDGRPEMDRQCLYTTVVDIASCGGTEWARSNAGNIGTRVPEAMSATNTIATQCVLQGWRYGHASTGETITAGNQTNRCQDGSSAVDPPGEFEDKIAGFTEFNRFPGFMTGAVYERLELFGLNLNALRDAREGIRSFRDWTREGEDGAFLLSIISEPLDAIISFGETIAGLIDSCTASSQWQHVAFGSCGPLSAFTGRALDYGRCKGGIFDGKLCRKGAQTGSKYSCKLDPVGNLRADGAAVSVTVYSRPDPSGAQTPRQVSVRTVAEYEAIVNACGPVSKTVNGYPRPIEECRLGPDGGQPTASNDPDNDNNLCTHGSGYRPRIDMCPDPNDEFCGLIAYKRGDASSLSPRTSPYPLPTDVTMGLYTPDYLLNGRPGGDGRPDFQGSNFAYITTYKPRPPVIAALDVGECRQPGQCTVTRSNAFNFNGQTEGPITIAGGQHKSTIQFYGWAAHDQMPIRQMVVDWGDGFTQNLPDAKIKNHKPFCGVTKECYIPAGANKGPTGLTCSTDSDCPAGYGRCENVGTCTRHPDRACTQDSDCHRPDEAKDVCNIRTFFGNSTDACEANYFEFSHVYTCNGQGDMPECTIGTGPTNGTYRCSRNPDRACSGPTDTATCAAGDTCIEDLAPKNGCWDSVSRACRFTPRVMIQDNWGWCTGECRSVSSTAGLADPPAPTTPGQTAGLVQHPYGGCYAGIPLGGDRNTDAVRLNVGQQDILTSNECSVVNPTATGAMASKRPWIVYPGSLQLRSRR